MRPSARAIERAGRIRAMQEAGQQSQEAQLGALTQAAAAAEKEIMALMELQADMRESREKRGQMVRYRSPKTAPTDADEIKSKLEAMSVSDLVEMQRCAEGRLTPPRLKRCPRPLSSLSRRPSFPPPGTYPASTRPRAGAPRRR